jgi:signal transduction protein with GAF and PtsI domain
MPEEYQTDLNYILSDLNIRTRTLEGKYNILGERLLVVNQNMIEEYKKIIKEAKTHEDDIIELKKEIENLKEILKQILKEIDSFAKKENIKVLEKYINLWNHLKFVTEQEVEELIKKQLEQKKGDIVDKPKQKRYK